MSLLNYFLWALLVSLVLLSYIVCWPVFLFVIIEFSFQLNYFAECIFSKLMRGFVHLVLWKTLKNTNQRLWHIERGVRVVVGPNLRTSQGWWGWVVICLYWIVVSWLFDRQESWNFRIISVLFINLLFRNCLPIFCFLFWLFLMHVLQRDVQRAKKGDMFRLKAGTRPSKSPESLVAIVMLSLL